MKRLEELARQYELPAEAPGQLAAILGEMTHEPVSITAVRDVALATDVHVADSLSGLIVPELRGAGKIADIGAGGGFPALVLAAALPMARITAVESVGRKCEFIRRAARAAGLSNLEVVNERAEAWSAGLGTQDVVTARALAPLNILLEYAAPLLRIGGVLVAYKGRRDAGEDDAGASAAAILGMQPLAVHGATPFSGSGERHLHVFEKAEPTPDRFPRRPGMARKRPLSGTK